MHPMNYRTLALEGGNGRQIVGVIDILEESHLVDYLPIAELKNRCLYCL